MAHAALGIAFRTDKLELDDTEGEKLSGAIQKVLRHYNIPDVASETKDWIGLIIVAGSIYGPRIAAASFDKKTRQQQTARDEASTRGDNVLEMTVGN